MRRGVIMKKGICALIIFIMSLFMPVLASNIDVQATMLSRSNEQDRVWAGTFQLVWNEFIDKYVRTSVRFWEETPLIAKELNKKSFNYTQLSENCYYKYSGNITKQTKKIIVKAIKKKFNETSDILDSLDLTPAKNRFLVYAILKKDFEFENEFDKLGISNFGKNMTAEYFGINNNTNNNIKKSVKVLFYNNSDDFAVTLNTKENEEVLLYKNTANKDFNSIYRDINIKASKYKGDKTFTDKDELKIPNIKFNVTKTFDELTNKRVTGTSFVINDAIETIIFNMNNKGVRLKSEAAMTIATTALIPEENKIAPRYFYFNDTFVVFLKEKDKSSPYFALRVHDISNYQ